MYTEKKLKKEKMLGDQQNRTELFYSSTMVGVLIRKAVPKIAATASRVTISIILVVILVRSIPAPNYSVSAK